ncbi:hypothetical protein J2S43_003680 [Catenuloplanes nepalensis]|uniref:DUF4232 domain-containing protein n=1 Tax=Catenuloplanes nepalensis TaxID=587533 RepID=A0ABT9MVA8_9ACTN|nr:DUF4232 domain-containing protein [Catenuloplanes nepalensis]MDP9795168.1 hypothetical protein [Catenuloplanes nepalensis]
MRRPFRVIAAAALLCTVTACGSTDETGSETAPGAATRSEAPAPVDSGAGASGVDACTGEDIKAEATVQEAGVALLAITNASDAACALDGWPTLGLLAADDSAIKVPVEEVAQPGPATATALDPGETAFAGFKWTACDLGAADCKVATTLTVMPPGGGTPVNATITGVEGGDQAVEELPVSGLRVGTIQPSTQGVVAW